MGVGPDHLSGVRAIVCLPRGDWLTPTRMASYFNNAVVALGLAPLTQCHCTIQSCTTQKRSEGNVSETGGVPMASNRKNAHRARLVSRRRFLEDSGSVAALGAATTALGPFARPAMAQTDLRKQILAIPGVDKGSPTDADWQKVGELCLGATKANVTAGDVQGGGLHFARRDQQHPH